MGAYRDRPDSPDGPPGRPLRVPLPLSRADLAGLAGPTPVSVSRVMSRWKKEGLIDSGRRWTALLDRSRLEELSTVET